MDDTKKESKVVEKVSSDTKLVSLPEETLAFFKGDEIRARVFFEKYALKDPSGKIVELLPQQMWERVSKSIAAVETTPEKQKAWEEKFFWLLQDFKFLPGGRVLFGAGRERRDAVELLRRSGEGGLA